MDVILLVISSRSKSKVKVDNAYEKKRYITDNAFIMLMKDFSLILGDWEFCFF